jgi:hypothetical protein
MTREFQASDVGREELEELRKSLTAADVEADVRGVFGRLVDNLTWLQAQWGRFQQFVQRRPPVVDQPAGLGADSGGDVTRGELTTRFRTISRE